MRRFRSPNALLFHVAIGVTLSYAGSIWAATPTLKDAIDAAWKRQPDAQSYAARLDEVTAKRNAAAALFPAPPSIELAQRTDQFNQNRGDREMEAAVLVPLWMPGTRNAAQRLAEVESALLDVRHAAAKLSIAGEVRDAYWQATLAQNDRDVAARKASEAATLMRDVERRYRAGELARTDLNQAQGAERLARASLAEAEARALRSQSAFTALTGLTQLPEVADPSTQAPLSADIHPQLAALQAAVQVQQARLAQVSSERREAPEVSLGWRRERDAFGSNYENSVRVGVRIPLATQGRNAPRIAAANAELLEAEAAVALAQSRLQADIDAAKADLSHAQQVEALAKERYQLALDTQSLHAKAFQLGELDLPMRLRSENERFDAELALSRARLEVGRATSRLNQALGVLP